MMHYTGLISVVKISMQGCYHFDRLNLSRTWYFNFLKLSQMETGTHKYIKVNVL